MIEQLKRKMEENDAEVEKVIVLVRNFLEKTNIPLDTNTASALIGIGVTVFRYHGYSDEELKLILAETLDTTRT